METGSFKTGQLFLVVCDGRNCDRIVEAARRRFASDPDIVFPRRAITRTPYDGLTGDAARAELHQAVTPAQFDRLRREGAFAFCWDEAGAAFAIPAGIETLLAAGKSVVVAAPGSMVNAIRRRYPQVAVIEIVPAGAEEVEADEAVMGATTGDGSIIVLDDGLPERVMDRFGAALVGRLGQLPPAGNAA